MTWKIRESRRVSNRLDRYRSDKVVINNYRRIVKDLTHSDNPASMGVPKKGKYGGCLGTHVTKSVVLVYSIDYVARRVDAVDLGNHKEVYGRDG